MTKKLSNAKRYSTAEKQVYNAKRTTRKNLYPHLVPKYDLAALTAEELKLIGEEK
jgi:hypothetical protein